ncbi:MAG: hypothetical protein ACI35T_07415, partial [Alistipes sp.]
MFQTDFERNQGKDDDLMTQAHISAEESRSLYYSTATAASPSLGMKEEYIKFAGQSPRKFLIAIQL